MFRIEGISVWRHVLSCCLPADFLLAVHWALRHTGPESLAFGLSVHGRLPVFPLEGWPQQDAWVSWAHAWTILRANHLALSIVDRVVQLVRSRHFNFASVR
eukprot:4879154-Amphidinium_carterae.2